MALAIGIIGVREFYRILSHRSKTVIPHCICGGDRPYGANALAPDDWHPILFGYFLETVASMIYGFNVEERNR